MWFLWQLWFAEEPVGEDGDEDFGAPIRRVERPKTARARPPKLKDNTNEESKSSGGGGGGAKNTAAPVGIFVDGKGKSPFRWT